MICSRCGNKFTWADEMASMAVRNGNTKVCRSCRSIETKKLLEILNSKMKGAK